MRLSELGELELIRRLFPIFSDTGEANINMFPYDDTAVLEMGDQYLLITTDLINRSTHMPRGSTGFQIGWYLMAINLSDLAAKGATPLAFLNSFALPPELDAEIFEDICEGIAACGRSYACPVIGGDTKSSSDMTLTGMAMGTVAKERFLPRVGCKPGDLIAVTGQLGRVGYAFVKINELEDSYEDKSDTYRELLLKLVLEIKPQLIAGQMLGKMGGVTASIDLSDGLGPALHQLMELNQVGFTVDKAKLPRVPMLEEIEDELTDEQLEEILLYTGGDYELLISIHPEQYKVARTALTLIGVPLTAIGEVNSLGETLLISEDAAKPIENIGFDHFRIE